ncbi:succinate dehydrogenase subunit 5, mitochondrial-like [Macadamia integrifolia]|uniref:succinate dehydrogenase subunit 5, mitochondrial-like n=1 Tax=Macadamia integrifolia TaxID=60698 RepID=UPI001C4EDDD6|nr:succinate dehydrogenase subunit 5, mitochondrial-like [Macadamia integrifolia]XP_042492631.1 succinate dehydrogenase subunit 5, mitochondrial-like [Macadamia integrifolia]XP_042492632.1 succinate dehydrogenase subunit 5, mitochondrial-like [Macadamia integrifolia]
MASRTAICRGILRINSGFGLRSSSSLWRDSILSDTVTDNASVGFLIAKCQTLVGQRGLFTSRSIRRGGVGEVSDCRPPFAMGIGNLRSFSDEGLTHMPTIADQEIENVFKDLMAASWDELPDTLIHDAKNALSKNTGDKVGQEILANVFRAAEAVEQFGGVLVSLRMEIDDTIGLSGENVRPLPDELSDALRAAYQRYTTYLDAFGPDESYLRKKVETELGTKMIHLKMRCSGLGAEWGKVTVLGTSGLSGSYVEQRAP